MEELSVQVIALRLFLAFAAGGVIGFERASHYQVAGLRTHILIAVGAALLMIVSVWIPIEYLGAKSGDPGRIAAQVVSGIGFLGAGAIIRLGNNVKGLTTAASLWLIAAVGMALGAGLYAAAGITVVISLFTLVFLDMFEKRLFPAERNKILELSYKTSDPDTTETFNVLKSFRIRIQSVDESIVKSVTGRNVGTKLSLLVGLPVKTDIAALTKSLEKVKSFSRLDIKENF
jgi:putative Mg2+ transporter-C (MgtC) family protein